MGRPHRNRHPLLMSMVLLSARSASALHLRWADGTLTRSFSAATRCTLEVRADSTEVHLPTEWRLLWVADSATVIEPIPLDAESGCESSVANVLQVDPPESAADSAAHLITARFCLTSQPPGSAARYVMDLAAGGAGQLKVVALDPADSTLVIESNEVTFNGGFAGSYPSTILRTESARSGLSLTVTAIGTGLEAAQSLAISDPQGRWQIGLSIVEQTDALIAASAPVAADVPTCLVEARLSSGALASAPLAANSSYALQSPTWYPSVMAETLGVSITPPSAWVAMQPMDFAFIHALSKFHLFYTRRRMVDVDLTATNLGHAWSTDLVTWHWSQLPRDTSVLDVSGGTWDNRHVWAPSIVVKDGLFHMFYTGVQTTSDGKKHQRIGHAISSDLDAWSRQGDPVLSAAQVDWALKNPMGFEGQQLRDPFVMPDPERPGQWLMYFVSVDSVTRPAMAVGIARSDGDFSQWVADANPLRSTDSLHTGVAAGLSPFGAHRIESPHAFSHEGRWWLGFTPGRPRGLDDLLPYNPVTFEISDSLGSPSDSLAAHWSTPQDSLYYLNYPSPDPRLQYWHASEHLVVGDHEYLAAWEDSLVGIAIGEISWTGPRTFVVGSASASNVGVERAPTLGDGEVDFRVTSAMPAISRVAFRLTVGSRMLVRLGIFDVAGRRVAQLLDQTLLPGARTVVWDGADGTGNRCLSGIYFVRLVHPRGQRVTKLVFLR